MSAEPPQSDARGGRCDGAGLLLLSAAVLTLEVLQTRIFSYCLHAVLVYYAVGIAFLGLGAAGTLLSLTPAWWRARLPTVACLGAALFAVGVVATGALFARTSERLATTAGSLGAAELLLLGALGLPYLGAGVAITACLSRAGRGAHRSYGLNLLGSAGGCFTVFVALRPLGAGMLLVFVALAGAGAAALFAAAGAHKGCRAVVAAAALLSAAPLVDPEAIFPFRPEPTGQLALLQQVVPSLPESTGRTRTRFAAWDPTGRIEVTEFPGLRAALPEPADVAFYSQDGSAGSLLLGVGDDLARAAGFFERTLYGVAHRLRGAPAERVLIVGLGGGPDVLGSLLSGAASITGVDINQSALDVMRGPLADFTGDLYRRPGVRVLRLDGRTFVRSSGERFDLMVLSGVDTKSLLAAGSLALSENTLYTTEAFTEYLEHLSTGGILALLRFGNIDRLRLSSTAVAALRRLGAQRPEEHLLVLRQGGWGSVLVGKEPLGTEAVQRVETWVAAAQLPDNGIRIPPYDLLLEFGLDFGLSGPPAVVWSPRTGSHDVGDDAGSLLAAVRDGQEAAFLEGIPLDVSPTSDDRPFFFDHQRRERLFEQALPHYRILGGFLLGLILLASAFVLAPVWLLLRRGPGSGLRSTLVCCSALGAGFLLLEIGLVQKLVLFLGHQTYSLTVVFATLLVGAGVGATISRPLAHHGRRLVTRLAVPGIVLATLLEVLLLERLPSVAATWPLPARIAAAVAGLLPLGFFLGLPFPTLLATLQRRAPWLLPWAIGANGFASVLGSSAALLGALLIGYRGLLLCGLALYVLAALAFPRPEPEEG